MPSDLPPGVTPYKDRHGKTRHRFRRAGLPARDLPGQPGDPVFLAAAQKAAAGVLRQPRRKSAAPRTLRAAWLEVNRSAEWRQLKASSKMQQIGVAERFLGMPIAPGAATVFGQMPFAGIRRGDVKKIIARYADRPHAGEAVLRLLRKLSLVALDLEWIESDPTFRVHFRPKLIGHRAWTDAELAQYERKWPLGSRQRLGYALALYTGQRRADVAAMSTAAYASGAIAVTQEKTGAPLLIPAHPDLVAAISSAPQSGAWLICATHGGRYTAESFGSFMADAIGEAGLSDGCRLHGLRKSAGRCLAEAGCTAHQIMAVLGHKTLAEAQRYTKEADQKLLAEQGMEKWARPRLTVVAGGK
jgi:integrase